ncbi:hypothetical protein PybrP1_000338 [[Pythium] brassicae (nom. inval.)]|nr:hypothetical protein PybrP1_000338 [[Pythium] brassicae (nom. inval.)]
MRRAGGLERALVRTFPSLVEALAAVGPAHARRHSRHRSSRSGGRDCARVGPGGSRGLLVLRSPSGAATRLARVARRLRAPNRAAVALIGAGRRRGSHDTVPVLFFTVVAVVVVVIVVVVIVVTVRTGTDGSSHRAAIARRERLTAAVQLERPILGLELTVLLEDAKVRLHRAVRVLGRDLPLLVEGRKVKVLELVLRRDRVEVLKVRRGVLRRRLARVCVDAVGRPARLANHHLLVLRRRLRNERLEARVHVRGRFTRLLLLPERERVRRHYVHSVDELRERQVHVADVGDRDRDVELLGRAQLLDRLEVVDRHGRVHVATVHGFAADVDADDVLGVDEAVLREQLRELGFLGREGRRLRADPKSERDLEPGFDSGRHDRRALVAVREAVEADDVGDGLEQRKLLGDHIGALALGGFGLPIRTGAHVVVDPIEVEICRCRGGDRSGGGNGTDRRESRREAHHCRENENGRRVGCSSFRRGGCVSSETNGELSFA